MRWGYSWGGRCVSLLHVCLAYGLATACSSQESQHREAIAPVAEAPVPDEQDATRARELLIDGRVAQARTLLEEALQARSDAPRLLWLAGAAAHEDGDRDEVRRHDDALARSAGWRLLLRARTELDFGTREKALALVRKAGELLRHHSDAVWVEALILERLWDDEHVAALARTPGLSPQLVDALYGKAIARRYFRLAASPPPIRPSHKDVQALAVEATAAVPGGVHVPLEIARGLQRIGELEEAVERLDEALDHHPDDPRLLAARIELLHARSPEDTGLQQRLTKQVRELVGTHRDDVVALELLVATLDRLEPPEQHADVIADIRARFPDSRTVERWDWQGTQAWGAARECEVARDTGRPLAAPRLVELRSPILRMLRRPKTRLPELRGRVAAAAAALLACDPDAPRDVLDEVAEIMSDTIAFSPRHDAQMAIAVAERGGNLELARTLANRAAQRREDALRGVEPVLTPSDRDAELRGMRALTLDARGFVDLKAGRPQRARELLEEAYRLWPERPSIALHLAELEELAGNLDRAEVLLLDGAVARGPGAVECRRRVEALWERHGTEASLERRIEQRQRTRRAERIEAVLAERAAQPVPVAPFDWSLPDGGRLTSQNLRGKVVVLVASTPWCSACRKGAPDLGKVVRQYSGRDDVQFVVVTESDQPRTQELYHGAGVEAPIAEEADWLRRAGINSYPTYVFLDRQGQVAFTANAEPDLEVTFPARIDAILEDT